MSNAPPGKRQRDYHGRAIVAGARSEVHPPCQANCRGVSRLDQARQRSVALGGGTIDEHLQQRAPEANVAPARQHH